jgi:putative transposase
MSKAYTQLHIHAVFAVKYRQALLARAIRPRLHLYMYGILKEEGQTPIIINGVSDHVHLLFRMKPSKNVSDLMRVVKCNTSRWINQQKLLDQTFAWQRGYGAFAVEVSRLKQLTQYIANQEAHHGEVSFKEEYLGILQSNYVEYEEAYLFDWILD